MNLPWEFRDKMKRLLGDEYEDFLKGYENENYYSLRVNTLKADRDKFFEQNLFNLSPVRWCDSGFYYDNETRPGRHPYHHAGVYYIQEASAMAPRALADIQKGQKVLDLCAAPGGKSTQAACLLQGEGLLVSNEIVPSRAKILSQNIERTGVKNCIVTNENPKDLEKHFPYYFDRIIVDAPCSGEGMFRKDSAAVSEWSQSQVEICAARQSHILESAHKMLAPNGKIVYSTCTFSPEENECVIADFLSRHPEYTAEKPSTYGFFTPGNPRWANGERRLENTVHLFPHRLKGEGHFVALLQKHGGDSAKIKYEKPYADKKALAEWQKFENEVLKDIHFENLTRYGNFLYSLPKDAPSLDKIKVLRAGLQLGEIKKNRFEPSHSLAMALKKENVRCVEDMPLSDGRVIKYLCGEEIPTENSEKGYRLICVDGYGLGWGKCDGNTIKNHYPKGLRIMK